jgi:hypothetical protein
MATVIRVEIRLEEEPDALYREACRRAALAVPARRLATELYAFLLREDDRNAARLMQALGELAGDLITHRAVTLGEGEAEPEWTIEVDAA